MTPERWIEVRGARTHNLRSVDVRVPHDRLVAFTGRSGSGKSSLAVDTIMAEAHRRSVRTMSAYARQFAAQFARPAVDRISGLCSTIFLDQGRVNRNPRSTLGTSTDIFDLLRVLFARHGAPACPTCWSVMTDHGDGGLCCPRHPGQSADRLDPKDFSFNLPFGACAACDGLGTRSQPDLALVVPDPGRSVRGGAISAFEADRYAEVHLAVAVAWCEQEGVDPDAPWADLPKSARRTLLTSTGCQVDVHTLGGTPFTTSYTGVLPWLEQRHREADSDRARARFGAFLQESACATCGGSRLGESARAYRLEGRGLAELCAMSLEECAETLAGLTGPAAGGDVVTEARDRLDALIDLGLGYLSLNRSAPTLSGGEGQRARLATQLGTELFGLMYVLDEPSAGLHPADIARLIAALRRLREQGNTVLVVEHDRQVISGCDWIVDIGPGAGRAGGRVLYAGPAAEIGACAESVTAPYLAGDRAPRPPRRRRVPSGALRIEGGRAHNLNDVDVELPLGVRVAITGVSGSGKSTLVRSVVLPALRSLGVSVPTDDRTSGTWRRAELTGVLDRVIIVDQSPIGRSPRSNAATYSGAFDEIRKLFAALPAAKAAGLTAKHFSFNLPEGRCGTCAGDGVLRLEMQFLPDAITPCEECGGRRYRAGVLTVARDGLTIADVLDLSVDEARVAFARSRPLTRAFDALAGVGLGYLTLGQAAPSLSGGEAQRLKLATELQQPAGASTLYLLDEPTTGLHMADVDDLMATLDGLVDHGHGVVLVEHDVDVIATSDHVIDMGPGGGRHGGRVVVVGTPEQVRAEPRSVTGQHL